MTSALRALLNPLASGGDFATDRPEMWSPNTQGWMRRTTAGEMVGPGRALTLSTWFACIRAISEDIGKLPLFIYRTDEDKGKSKATDHPLFRLLRSSPNPEMTAQTFRELMTGWGLSWGNAFAEIERDGAGNPIALWPIHPSRSWLHRVDGRIVLDVRISILDRPESAVRLEYADVIHIRGFGDDPLGGLSVAGLAAESLGVSLAAQTYGAAFFGNGAMPLIVLTHPGKLSEVAQTNMRESWKKRYAGEDKLGVGILQEGVKIDKLTIPPEEAQFLQTRQFQRQQVAEWFRMPPHKVQNLEHATFSNIEHQGIEYVTDTLTPWFVRWEQELERKLLDERDREIYDIQHLASELMRGDMQARANFYRTMISTAAMTPNEARESENMCDGGAAADELFIQGAMTTIERVVAGESKGSLAAPEKTAQKPVKDEPVKENEPNDQNDQAKQSAAALMPVFQDAERRCSRKEQMAVNSAARRFKAGTPQIAAWAREFYAEHSLYLQEAFAAPVLALTAAVRASVPAFTVSDVISPIRDHCARAAIEASQGRIYQPSQPISQTIFDVLTLEL